VKLTARSSGFTLTEIVFTISISVLLLLGVMSGMAVATKSRNYQREKDIAHEAARTRLDTILDLAADGVGGFTLVQGMNNRTFPVPNTTPVTDPNGMNDYPTGVIALMAATNTLTHPNGGGTNPGLVQVEQGPAPMSGDLFRVTVTVTWRSADNAGGNVNTVELSAFVANRK